MYQDTYTRAAESSAPEDGPGAPSCLGQVLPRLYVGSCKARAPDILKAVGITVVISALTAWERDTLAGCADPLPDGVREYTLELDDTHTGVFTRVLTQCVALLETEWRERGATCLVHCYAGRSRSPALVAGFILHCQAHTSAAEALALVARGRPGASPNASFVRQLEEVAEQREKEDTPG